MNFSLHDTDPSIVPLQRMLNEMFSLNLDTDGNIGPMTQAAIGQYQTFARISESDENGPIYGEQTQAAAKPFIESKYLQPQDYVDAANDLDVEVAAIKAFSKTESRGSGFLKSGYPVVLFERHLFYRHILAAKGEALADYYAKNYPSICNKTAGGYIGGSEEVHRLSTAMSLNNEAAIESASYGMYQILGQNFKECGYASAADFVEAMKQSERNQIKAFVGFIKSSKYLHQALKDKDWKECAWRYNGPNYAKNKYDEKLASNYQLALKE